MKKLFESKLTDIEIEAIRHRKILGESASILAECFEVSVRTIHRHCRGIPPAWKVIEVGGVIGLRQEGYTFLQIAQRIEADRTAIHRALKRHMMGAA
jgi:hypothetical protein